MARELNGIFRGAVWLMAAVCAVGVASVPAMAAAPLLLQGVGRATAPVEGAWQFHEGDDLRWAAPGFDDSQWQPIETGRPWEGQGHRNLTGFGWYRRHVVLDGARTSGWNEGLLLEGVEDAAEVYWNGRLVGGFGRVWPNAEWYGSRSVARVCDFGPADQQPHEGVLAIRVWKAPYAYFSLNDTGGLVSTPLLGNLDALTTLSRLRLYAWIGRHEYTFAVAFLSAIVSLLAFVGWLRDRSQWMLLWLAIYTIRPLALGMEAIPGVPWRVGYGSVGVTYMAGDAALWLLLLYLLGLREHIRLVRWTQIFACTVVCLQVLEGCEQLFDWTRAPRFFLLVDVGTTVPCFLLTAWALVLVGFAFRKKLDRARWVLALSCIAADFTINLPSIVGLGTRWTHWHLADNVIVPIVTIGGNSLDLATLCSTLLLVAVVYAVWHYETEQAQQRARVAEEYRSAQEVQRVLVPQSVPEVPGYALTCAYRPAQEVGGDFFQVIPLERDTALLVIGDVSGKGLHAAMTVALIVGALRTAAAITSDPGELLARLNALLYGRLRNGFATCLILRLEPDGRYAAANAGHLPPYRNGAEVPLPPALPLGLVPVAEYDTVDLQISPHDRLTFCTDGLPEARSATGELFGFERLAELLAAARDAAAIADAAQRFGQDDDITVLTLELAPMAAMRAP